MEFYSLKTRSIISVPREQLRKRRHVRILAGGGRQERYAVVAAVDVQGTPMTLSRLVSRAQFEALDVPEDAGPAAP
jgi:hypothetical protein